MVGPSAHAQAHVHTFTAVNNLGKTPKGSYSLQRVLIQVHEQAHLRMHKLACTRSLQPMIPESRRDPKQLIFFQRVLIQAHEQAHLLMHKLACTRSLQSRMPARPQTADFHSRSSGVDPRSRAYALAHACVHSHAHTCMHDILYAHAHVHVINTCT